MTVISMVPYQYINTKHVTSMTVSNTQAKHVSVYLDEWTESKKRTEGAILGCFWNL